jgi:hypothetical protein
MKQYHFGHNGCDAGSTFSPSLLDLKPCWMPSFPGLHRIPPARCPKALSACTSGTQRDTRPFTSKPGGRSMTAGLADQIREEIAATKEAIEEQKAYARKNVQNVAAETEVAQRLRALHTRLDELERNLMHVSDVKAQ